MVPETFSSLAGKGEPAKEMETKGPMWQQESQQSVVTWKPSGEGLEEGGSWELCQMPGERYLGGVGWDGNAAKLYVQKDPTLVKTASLPCGKSSFSL